MRIIDIRERSVDISRYAGAAPAGGLTTSVVTVVTDRMKHGRPVVGYGCSSFGRYAQSGLIRERFAPRLLACNEELDPPRAWQVMMTGEKPGGHGERCVAVGTLDMALWDAAAKIEDVPLYDLLARYFRRSLRLDVAVYAGGGYPYPQDDLAKLRSELEAFRAAGFTHAKIKIGGGPVEADLPRIEMSIEVLGGAQYLAVDAMNAYDAPQARRAAAALAPYGLWWFEDVCDPLDFATHAEIARAYDAPLAAGEALFSLAEAKLLHAYAGLRPECDVLVFDPVHCYGLPGYVQIVDWMERSGWPRSAFWPHGGHLFSLHVAAALELGGAEVNPRSFAPFGGLYDGARIESGRVSLPDAPGVGFEAKSDLYALLR